MLRIANVLIIFYVLIVSQWMPHVNPKLTQRIQKETLGYKDLATLVEKEALRYPYTPLIAFDRYQNRQHARVL